MSGPRSKTERKPVAKSAPPPIVPDNIRTVDILKVLPASYSNAALDRLFSMRTELERPDDYRQYPACSHSAALPGGDDE